MANPPTTGQLALGFIVWLTIMFLMLGVPALILWWLGSAVLSATVGQVLVLAAVFGLGWFARHMKG
jgi:hypothetical protein